MSVGNDLVDVAKDAKAVYDEAKRLKQELDQEEMVAEGEIQKLKAFSEKFQKVTKNLPDSMSVSERRAFIKATEATVKERIKTQEDLMDFEELAKLNAQLFTLNNQLLKLELLDTFDVRSLINTDEWEKLIENIDEVHAEIKTQMKARGFVRISTRVAILAIDLGVLVAKAAA